MKIEIDELGYYTAPDGSKWRLVPVELSIPMIDAAMGAGLPHRFSSQYAAAIKAAPVYVPPAPTTRYDWSKIPEGYDWAATDEDGEVFVYSKKPYARDYLWFANGGGSDFYCPGRSMPRLARVTGKTTGNLAAINVCRMAFAVISPAGRITCRLTKHWDVMRLRGAPGQHQHHHQNDNFTH